VFDSAGHLSSPILIAGVNGKDRILSPENDKTIAVIDNNGGTVRTYSASGLLQTTAPSPFTNFKATVVGTVGNIRYIIGY
jgi:hypothetical protein